MLLPRGVLDARWLLHGYRLRCSHSRLSRVGLRGIWGWHVSNDGKPDDDTEKRIRWLEERVLVLDTDMALMRQAMTVDQRAALDQGEQYLRMVERFDAISDEWERFKREDIANYKSRYTLETR